MTRSQIETAIYQRLEKNLTSVDTTTQARIRGFVDQRLRRILSIPDLSRIRTAYTTVTCTASESRLALPWDVARVSRIWDTANQLALVEADLPWLRQADPAQVSSGTPVRFVPVGYQAVSVQPSGAFSLYVKSTEGADTTQTVYVQGYSQVGLQSGGSVTLTGTTAAAVPGFYSQVTKFYLGSLATGTVTLYESTTDTALGAIGSGKADGYVYIVLLWPFPSTALTYNLDYERKFTGLETDFDSPPFHEEFHDVLVLGGVMDEYQRLNDARYAIVAAEYERRIKDLKMWHWWGNGATPVAGWRQTQGGNWSPLGGWFPASSWD